MSKVTAVAPSNIAFVKYWGARDLERTLPWNPSISMTLSACVSRCTAETVDTDRDEILWDAGGGRLVDPDAGFAARVQAQIDRIRAALDRPARVRVATGNTFPSAAGIASSASGGTALALALAGTFGVEPDAAALSRLARLGGSGSAARAAQGGYVEWPAGNGPDDGLRQLAPASHWALCDVVAVVDAGPKAVSSLEGHRRAPGSPYFAQRQQELIGRLDEVRTAIRSRDLERLGRALETEAVDLHLIAMSSRPPVFYWKPATLAVLDAVRGLRRTGTVGWATMDAGPNVHVICPPEAEPAIAESLAAIPGVQQVLRDRVGDGPRTSGEHLF